MVSYQILTDRYKQLQLKNKSIKKEYTKELKIKDKEIEDLKNQIKLLQDEIEERNKKIQEKNLIIGGLLKRIK